ncbi:MAG: nucleotidyltransferase domain-containing protein [Candidatus Melainabacteria bacterium]|nr:nucleotidyltransferase domain-containing protein [Candidatus Melainabacteria bacterium]
MENDYIDIVKKIVLENIPKDKFNIFLFGSRVREKHRQRADIDIGVKGNTKLDKKIIWEIKDTIEESIVPYKVDIIDFVDVNPEFKEEALKDIKIWNKVESIDIN